MSKTPGCRISLVEYAKLSNTPVATKGNRRKLFRKTWKVQKWWARLDQTYKIPTGEYIFIMLEQELQQKPLPSTIYLNEIPVTISYRAQPKRCFKCNKYGHTAREFKEELNNDDNYPELKILMVPGPEILMKISTGNNANSSFVI